MNAAHTPGPWAVAMRRDYPQHMPCLRVECDAHDAPPYNEFAGIIDGRVVGFAGSAESCWEWLERFAYFKARAAEDERLLQLHGSLSGASAHALAKATEVQS